MKLTSPDIANLITLLNTATLCGIDTVVIADGKARGVSPAKTSVLLSTENLPKMNDVCIGRVKELQSRLSLFASNKDTVVQTKESDRGDIVSLEITAGRNKAQYRCASVALMGEKIPKNVPDAYAPMYSILLLKDEAKMLLDSVRVMNSKKIALIIKPDGTVNFDTMDDSNDHFTVAVENPATSLQDHDETIVNYFAVEIFSPVLRELMNSDAIEFSVGMKTLSATINGHKIILVPQINEEED